MEGLDRRATEAALVAGTASVAVGSLLVSAGFGALSTLLVVLPCAWVLGDVVLSRPQPREAGPVQPPSAWVKTFKVLGMVAAAVILVPLALLIALLVACFAMTGAGTMTGNTITQLLVLGAAVLVLAMLSGLYSLLSK